jgi:hypothetical protein
MVKMQPVPGRSRTRRIPLLASTLRRQIDSPSPSPDRSELPCVKRLKHFSEIAGRQAAAAILNLDQDAIGGRIGIQ